MFSVLRKLKPAAPKAWLLTLAGVMWFGIGLMLDGFAIRWLRLADFSTIGLFSLVGLLLASAIYRFGFFKLADKNILRIRSLDSKKASLHYFTHLIQLHQAGSDIL